MMQAIAIELEESGRSFQKVFLEKGHGWLKRDCIEMLLLPAAKKGVRGLAERQTYGMCLSHLNEIMVDFLKLFTHYQKRASIHPKPPRLKRAIDSEHSS